MRRILQGLIAVLFACLSTLQARAAPNLVVLMADDLDEATLDKALELGLLPTIQQELIAGGLRFDESFTSNSLCCPSRATFLTGQYTHNHGVHNITVGGSFASFDDSETLPVWLQRAGYRTGIIGKYLNGYGNDQPLNDPAGNKRTYVSPGWNDWEVMHDTGELSGSAQIGSIYAGAYCMYHYTFNRNGTLINYGASTASQPSEYQVDVIAQRAGVFIDEAANHPEPLFLYLSPASPHYEICLPGVDPFDWDVRPPDRYAGTLPPSVMLDVYKPSFDEADVSDKPAWFAAKYPSMTSAQIAAVQNQFRHRIEALRAIDDLVATVKQHLVAAGRWQDTVLVFTSDNGWLYGDHRAWGKVLAYEESIRVPLLMRGPGVPAGQERQALVLNNDLAPTLSMLGGATPALACDGRDLSPLFAQDLPPGWRRRILVEHYRDVPGFPVSFSDYFAVRTGVNEVSGGAQAKLVAWSIDGTPNGTEQYGLVQDPQETASVHAEGGVAAANRAALSASLEVLRHCGAAGDRSCLDAERDVEAIFFCGFD